MTINIRDATSQDSSIIVQLISELAAASAEASPISPEYVRTYLAASNSKVLLAETNGRVIGLLSYSIRPDLYHAGNCCLIEELIVQEEMRGQGAGSALITELFSRLKDCVEVSLGVMPENTRAIRFYRKHGLAEEALLLERHFKK
jgi:ribosomal protein S18 acetylase RimI-like enzyme